MAVSWVAEYFQEYEQIEVMKESEDRHEEGIYDHPSSFCVGV